MKDGSGDGGGAAPHRNECSSAQAYAGHCVGGARWGMQAQLAAIEGDLVATAEACDTAAWSEGWALSGRVCGADTFGRAWKTRWSGAGREQAL